MANVNKTIHITIDGKEVENNLKSIRAAIIKTTNELNKMTVGSDEYIAHSKKLAELKKIYVDYRKELKLTEKELKAGDDQLNNTIINIGALSSAYMAASVALKKFVSSTQQYVDAYATIDDAMTGVMKTTGMTREEVEALHESLKGIDTRTSTEELLTIAQIGGRMGLAKDQIEDFTRAVDLANVALGDSFSGGAEEISSVLGKISLAFKETRDANIGDSLTRIGSAINEVGGKANATEPNIAAFVQRVGSMPEAFRPSVQEAIALGAAFEESSIDAEVASRAFGILMNKASTDVEGFAKVMGKPVDAVRELINSNPTQFFTEFAKSLQGMNATQIGETLNGLGLNADGVKKIVGAMSESYDRFNEILQTSNSAFAENVSMMNEYNNVNNNAAAQLEKARKRMQEARVELGEKLIPIVTKLYEVLGTTSGWLSKNISVLKSVVIPVVGAYVSIMGIALVKEKGLLAINKAKAALIALQKKGMAALNLVTATYNLIIAKQTGNTVKAAAAQQALNAAMKANPWGIVLTAIIAVVGAISSFAKKTNEAAEAQKDLNAEIETQYNQEKKKIEDLVSILDSENSSRDQKLKAISTLKEIIPGYVAELDKEGKVVNNNRKAIDDYLKSLKKKITYENLQKAYNESQSNLVRAESNLEFETEQAKNGTFIGALWDDVFKARTNSLVTAQKEVDKQKKLSAYILEKMDEMDLELISQTGKNYNETYGFNENILGNLSSSLDNQGTVESGSGSSSKTDPIADFEKKLADFRKRQQNASLEGWAKTKQGIIDSYQEMIDEANRLGKEDVAEQLTGERDSAIAAAGEKYMNKMTNMLVEFVKQAETLKADGGEESELSRIIVGTNEEWEKKIVMLKENITTVKNILGDLPDGDENREVVQTALDQMNQQLLNSTLEQAKAVSNAIKEYTKSTDDFILAEQKEMDKANLTDLERQKLAIEEKYDLEIQKIQEVYDARAAKDANDPELANLEAQIKQLKEMKVRATGRARGNNIWENLLNIDWKNFKDNWQDNLQTMTGALQEFANAAFDIFNSINQIQTNQENAAFDEWCDIQDEKADRLNQQLEDGVISQEYYNAQMEAMEKERAEKEKKLRHEQFERERIASLTQAIINGALSITMILAQMGPILGAIPMALSAAMTAAQIAVIASQANPYARGGYINGEQLALMGEEGQEWVASNKLVKDKKTAPVIAALEAYQRGDQNAIDELTAVSEPAWGKVSQGSKKLSRTFASQSQAVTNVYNTNSNNTVADTSELLNELKQMNRFLSDPKNRQAYISRKTQLEFEKNENELKEMARL